MSRFELLAPAGSLSALKAAVNAGADAVYVGGSKFGARAYADNPPCDELIQGINFCHLRGRKIYLTVNTLFKNQELFSELTDYLRPYYEAGLDAVIVQDLGAMRFISKHFPGLDIHLSTQASVTMAEGADFLKSKTDGVTRVVPARELSLDEMIRFRKSTDLEIEVFVHGALCYCYSGQCLLSSMIGGRSGNRGRCAQPCRKLYDGRYLLSPKDQCLLLHIHELMDIGIDSFKIEGRMKSPEYTAGVVSVYRKYIDLYEKLGSAAYKTYLKDHATQVDKDIDVLKDLYNRGGFNEGYLFKHNGPDMMCFDRPNHSGVAVGEVIETRGREAVIRFSKQVNAHDVIEIRDDKCKVFDFALGQGFDKGETFGCITMKGRPAAKGMSVYRTKNDELLLSIADKYINRDIKVPVRCRFAAHLGSPYTISFMFNDICVTEEGELTEQALKAPVTKDSLTKQIDRLGETEYVLEGEIEFDIDDEIFIPSSKINELRRAAIDKLTKTAMASFSRSPIVEWTAEDEHIDNENCNSDSSLPSGDYIYSYSVWSRDQLDAVLKHTDANTVYYNLSSFHYDDILQIKNLADGRELIFGLPYVCRASVYGQLENLLRLARDNDMSLRFLARNFEEISLLRSFGFEYRTDYNVYAMNNLSSDVLNCGHTLPVELNSEEIGATDKHNAEMIVYGYQPVMVSTQCVYKNKFSKCRDRSSNDFTTITDELGHDFRCRQMCEFCTNVIYNSAKLNLIQNIDIIRELGVWRFRVDFTFESPEEIDEFFKDPAKSGSDHFTNGHFLRGVQ